MSSSDHDPRPWRRAPADENTIEAKIGAFVRRLPRPSLPDDLHLAQTRQIVLQRGDRSTRPAFFTRPSAVPLWALVIACVLLGGVATSIAGIAVFKYARPASITAGGGDAGRVRPASRHSSPRRFRLATPAAATFELSVSDEGAEISMFDGQEPARLSGPTLPGPVRLTRDLTWRESSGAVVAIQPPVPNPVAAPVAPSVPLPVLPETGPPRRGPTARTQARAAHLEAAAEAPLVETASAPPSQPPPIVIAPLATEAQVVADALAVLRAHGDPAGALLKLDEHARRFPGGTLGREADAVRVEAWLALGDQGRALAVLDRMDLHDRPGEGPIALVRAELRAGAGRCAEADAEFTRILGAATNDDSAARALYGRAACRLDAGDRDGARADFESYLRRFPRGPRRAEIERMLAETRR